MDVTSNVNLSSPSMTSQWEAAFCLSTCIDGCLSYSHSLIHIPSKSHPAIFHVSGAQARAESLANRV